MARKQRLALLLIMLALACGGILIYEMRDRQQVQSFNAALQDQDWDRAAAYSPQSYARFVKAYESIQNGEFSAAVKLYGSLENIDDVELRRAAQFNLANAYLHWALSVDLEHDSDIALPLVELAKQSYRSLLQQNPQHWDAKYNLERALQLFPDSPEQAIQEWQAPENSPRSLATFRADKALP
jgi:mxaK protein